MKLTAPRAFGAPGRRFAAVALAPAGLAGCAHIEFDTDKGLTYFEPVPHLLVTTDKECVVSATLLMLPGPKKHLNFADGYGSAQLSVTLSNGMITEAGQTVDNKVPEILSALAELKTAGVREWRNGQEGCGSAMLYPIVNGAVVTKDVVPLPATVKRP